MVSLYPTYEFPHAVRQRLLREAWERNGSYYKKQCGHCGAEFFASRPEAKWCSRACTIKVHNERAKSRKTWSRRKRCVTCGAVFVATRCDGRFCSGACRQKAYRDRTAALRVKQAAKMPEALRVINGAK